MSVAARRMWAEWSEADGNLRPPEVLRARVERFLSLTTWAKAIELTGLSRRTLERVERGAFCTPDELLELAVLMRLNRRDVPDLVQFDDDSRLPAQRGG